MNEIENAALQTFSLVPEVYQQAFKEAGADFPDELVAAIKQDPNQASKLLQSDKELKKAVIQIFQANQEAILKAAKASQQKGMFKVGGKLYYGLKKLQQGGAVPAFNDLPILVYNENGVPVGPVALQRIMNSGNRRILRYMYPTQQARLNNMVNQSKMLWNPESLQEERVPVVIEYSEKKDRDIHPSVRRYDLETRQPLVVINK